MTSNSRHKGGKRKKSTGSSDDRSTPPKKNAAYPSTPPSSSSFSSINTKPGTLSTSTLITPAGDKVSINGATLQTIRSLYGKSDLYLEETQTKTLIFSADVALRHGQEYKCMLLESVLASPPPEVPSREAICAILEENTPSTSQFAASNVAGCWRRNPKVAKYTFIHRPTSGTPVVLLDPVLSELYEDIIDKKYCPTSEDCKAAKSLMDRLSIGFDDETKMQQSVDQWAADYGWQMVRHNHADANWLTGDCLALNSESKNEKGSGGGSSYIQNVGYYTKHWAKATRKAVNKSLCPTILIEFNGPELSVNGAVFGSEGIMCDPFITTSLLCNQYDYNHLSTAAITLGAITKATKKLISYYANLEEGSCDGFPFYRAISIEERDGSIPAKLTYTKKIKELVYLADMTSSEGVQKVVVKFAHQYSKQAHKICMDVGCAPKLYHFAKINRFFVVVMECIEGAKVWTKISNKNKPAAKAKVKTAIAHLHDQGFVHGDLRGNNILVVGNRVAIIDFDWSGPVDQHYPLFINHESITWPEGVQDGQPMRKEHDTAWIDREFV